MINTVAPPNAGEGTRLALRACSAKWVGGTVGGRTHCRAGGVLAVAAALIVTAGCARASDSSEDDIAFEDGIDAAAGSPGADVSTADPSGEQQCSLVDAETVSKATGLDLLLSVSTSSVREDNCWWSEPGTTSTAEQDAVTLIVEHWAMADLAACLELLARGETVPNSRGSGLVHVAKMPADDGLFGCDEFGSKVAVYTTGAAVADEVYPKLLAVAAGAVAAQPRPGDATGPQSDQTGSLSLSGWVTGIPEIAEVSCNATQDGWHFVNVGGRLEGQPFVLKMIDPAEGEPEVLGEVGGMKLASPERPAVTVTAEGATLSSAPMNVRASLLGDTVDQVVLDGTVTCP